tara:strand:- start:72 stop:410 length:339 start_codon:yes stop_codon:yes gene_type:complete
MQATGFGPTIGCPAEGLKGISAMNHPSITQLSAEDVLAARREHWSDLEQAISSRISDSLLIFEKTIREALQEALVLLQREYRQNLQSGYSDIDSIVIESIEQSFVCRVDLTA